MLRAALRNPIVLAVASGVLLVVSFPKVSLGPLAWVALAPMFVVCVQGHSPLRLALYCYITGVVMFAGTCYWVYGVMHNHGGLSSLTAFGVTVLFVLFFSLYFPAFGALAAILSQRWKGGALFLLPFLWVTVEWVRAFVPWGGFPWDQVGYALADFPGWTQLAAYTGIYGLSFLVALVSAAVAAYWLEPDRRRLYALGAIAAVLALSAWLGWVLPAEAVTQEVVLVQPNLPQLDHPASNWAANNAEELDSLEALTASALENAKRATPPLAIWPELPVPLFYHHDPMLRQRLSAFAQRNDVAFLTGFTDYRSDPGEAGDDDGEGGEAVAPLRYPYNSAVLIANDGSYIGQYDKIHLVPFGEYLPMEYLLGWAEPLVQEVSGYRPGDRHAVLPIGDEALSVFICYEAIFPGLTREFVRRGATVLVNISNDGWFGRSSAGGQHLAMARIRAVETGRFILRATNTGVTAVIDPRGRIVARAEPRVRTAIRAGFAPRREMTFFVQYGDWFAALCALATAAAIARKYWLDAVEVTV